MLTRLQAALDRVAAIGLTRRVPDAELTMADPDQAWKLLADPMLWGLWLPDVRDVLERPGRIVPGAYFRVALRQKRSTRLGFGSPSEGHVQIEVITADRFVLRIVASGLIERYEITRSGPLFRCRAESGDSEFFLHELARESAP